MDNLKKSIENHLIGYEILEYPKVSINETKKEIEKKYLTVKCQKCNEIFKISIRNIFRNYETQSIFCKKCRIKKRYNTEYNKLILKLKSQDLEPITKIEEYNRI